MIIEEDIQDFLAHYGVKGMKWGVRRDRYLANRQARRNKRAQKYILEARVLQTKISELENSGKRPNRFRTRKIGNLREEQRKAISNAEAKAKGKLTETQKKILKGAAVAGVLIAAGVAYSTIQSGNGRRLVEKGKDFFKDKHDPGWKLDRSLSNPMSSEAIMKKIVPAINPGYGDPGTKVNCRRATFAYEMRRRGYDVMATKTSTGQGQTAVGMKNALDVVEKDLPTGRFAILTKLKDPKNRELVSEFASGKIGENDLNPTSIFYDLPKKVPDGARGELGMIWGMGGGHSMAWEKINGKLVIFDTQNGKRYSSAEEFKEMADLMVAAGYTRLDDKTLDTNFLMRWVKNA